MECRPAHGDCVVAIRLELENVSLPDAMILQLVDVDDVVLLLVELSVPLPSIQTV